MLPSTDALWRYFRRDKGLIFAAPLTEGAPLCSRPLTFCKAACIRSIWA